MDPRIGECRPYQAKMSPDVCRNNRAMNRDGCRGCEGLKNIVTPKPAAEPKPAAPAPITLAAKHEPAAKPTPAQVAEVKAPPLPVGWLPYRFALRKAMEDNDLTPTALAAASGLVRCSIYNWLQGRSLPILGSARIIDKALGVSLAEEYKHQLPERLGQKIGGPAKAGKAGAPPRTPPGEGALAPCPGPHPEPGAPPLDPEDPFTPPTTRLSAQTVGGGSGGGAKPGGPARLRHSRESGNPSPGLSAEQFEVLRETVQENLAKMAAELNRGLPQMCEMIAAALRAAAKELALDRRGEAE